MKLLRRHDQGQTRVGPQRRRAVILQWADSSFPTCSLISSFVFQGPGCRLLDAFSTKTWTTLQHENFGHPLRPDTICTEIFKRTILCLFSLVHNPGERESYIEIQIVSANALNILARRKDQCPHPWQRTTICSRAACTSHPILEWQPSPFPSQRQSRPHVRSSTGQTSKIGQDPGT